MILHRVRLLFAGLAQVPLALLAVPASGQDTGQPAPVMQSAVVDVAQLANMARRFGSRGSVLQISLSPEGDKVAFIAPLSGGREQVYVADVAGGSPVSVMVAEQEGGHLAGCKWASQDYLICNLYGTMMMREQVVGFSRLFVVRTDGSGAEVLTAGESHRAIGLLQFGGNVLAFDVQGQPNQVLLSRQFVTEARTGTLVGGTEAGLGIEQVDLATLRRRQVEKPREGIAGYVADENGVLRVLATYGRDPSGYVRGDLRYSFLRKGARQYEPLPIPDSIEEFNVYAVESSTDRAIGIGRYEGFMRVFSIALDGTAQVETLLDRPGVDVDQLIRVGRRNRVVGAGYATDRRQVEIFDPALKPLLASLGRALGGGGLLEVIDASADESKLLVVYRSDINPGMTYLYDKASRQLQEVLPLRAQLQQLQLSPMQAISYKAADGTSIPAYLTLPPGVSSPRNLPAIVMPHGGPQARDEWGFDWMVQFYAQRGYAVIQPNFRGSAGYGEAWMKENALQSWQIAVGDVADAGRWLVQQGIADPSRLAIVGWSYGGYAALQAAVTDPALFKGVVAIAPLTDLDLLREDARNFSNYNEVSAFLGRGQHLDHGSPAKQAVRLIAPVMLVHGTRDGNVRIRHSEVMAERLASEGRPAKFLRFETLDHALYDSEARAQMLAESELFLLDAFSRGAAAE